MTTDRRARDIVRATAGATATEHIFLATLIAVAALVSFDALGASVDSKAECVALSLGGGRVVPCAVEPGGVADDAASGSNVAALEDVRTTTDPEDDSPP